jgi:arylsulfatase A-like enzyme
MKAAVLLAAVALGCGVDCTPPTGEVRTNVVLVTVDTLRADHLGCYGSTTVHTPSLDRLAAEGTLFERCWSQTHVTVPSHVTLLTSLPLAEHGVVRNDGRLAHPVDALPDAFARAGYRTAAFVSVALLGPRSAMGELLRGLEEYRAPRRASVQTRAEETNGHFFRWLRGACREPFFAWLHYYDPHMPYTPPAPFDAAYYQDDPYDPRHTSMNGVTLNFFFHELGGVSRRLAQRAAEVRRLKSELHLSSRQVRSLVLYPEGLAAHAADPDARARLRRRLTEVGDVVRRDLPYRRGLADWLTGVRDLRFPLARYAGEVSYVDAEIGRLRAELEALHLEGRTVLVVTADHGESLGEHGVYFDHFGLHEPNLRVPLIVWGPGHVAPARRTDPARGLDVAPTLLRLAGLPVPPTMQGRDLFAPGTTAEPLVAEASQGRQVMILDGPWKLILTLRDFQYVDAFGRDAGATELYDLQRDPGEAENVVRSHADVARTLAARLDSWMTVHRDGSAPAAAPPSPAVERSLRALGYTE